MLSAPSITGKAAIALLWLPRLIDDREARSDVVPPINPARSGLEPPMVIGELEVSVIEPVTVPAATAPRSVLSMPAL